MLTAMRHRGPDGQGTLEFAGGAAGMVRLALVDLSPRGQQPLWSADRRCAILFNGEIYNFREHRNRLAAAGYPFQSATDTEVVLALYRECGLDFVQHLRGMFALVIFDWREAGPDASPEVIFARDPLGIKPLYLAETANGDGGSSVVFASELRAVLASGEVCRTISRDGLADFLSYGFVMQPRTMIAGVRMMMPGTIEVFRAGVPRKTHRFWHMPPATILTNGETFTDAAKRLRAELETSVRLHALADAPVGAFLSGGIDSTAVVALMRPHISDLRVYTLRLPDVPGMDEADEAAKTAIQYECVHTIVPVTGDDVARWLPAFAHDLDSPSVDGLNTWLVSQAAAHDVKGVLSGLGGDEWFAGYPVVKRMVRYRRSFWGRIESLAGKIAQPMADWLPSGWWRDKFDSLATRRSPLAAWFQPHTVFHGRVVAQLLGGDSTFRGSVDRLAQQLDAENGPDWRHEGPVGLGCHLDTRAFMRCQLLRDSDATSMAHSLELRVPLVDPAIATLARQMPDHFKIDAAGRGGLSYASSGAKRVLVEAVRDCLPADAPLRPKRGFALPQAVWMRGPLGPLVADACSLDTIRSRGWIDPDPLFADPRRLSDRDRHPQLWALLILELWAQAVLDAPLPSHDFSATSA